ncbi:coagulation factor IX-like [Nilaparvata lugens]|uniref:coagulation factor IX-like n=1 Tax=Nilaparvata lugens TaxID=108931 RepID=UPI00193D29FD|nr:coagulation factor IX-like [Nilaparvata lugens]
MIFYLIILLSSVHFLFGFIDETDHRSAFKPHYAKNNSRSLFDDFTFITVPNLTGLDVGALFGHPSNMTFGQPWKPYNLHTTSTMRSTTSRHTPGTTHDTSPFTSTEDSLSSRPSSSTDHPLSSSSSQATSSSSASSTGSGTAVASSSSSSFSIATTTETSGEAFTAAYSPIGYEVECGLSNYSSFTSGKIVGGVAAERGQFPWQISLQVLTDTSARHICGGAIVSSHWIVTAAHCVYKVGPEKLSVVAGDYNLYTVEGHEQRRRVVKIIKHNYVRQNFSNDIALLQVWPKLRLDGFWTAPICIPMSSLKFDSGSATVTGWGRLSENGGLAHILQQVTLPIIPKKRCNELYESAGYGDYLNKCQMCCGLEDGGADSCQGHSLS